MEILIAAVVLAAALVVAALLLGRRKSGPGPEALRAEFQSLYQEILRQAQEQFLRLADERFKRQSDAGATELEGKKALIDQQLQTMQGELTKVSELMRTLERDREGKFGELAAQLKAVSDQTGILTASTQRLGEALANSRARGQWGERMAEDILRLVGLVENVNYRKQVNVAGANSRPDFVFFLPDNRKLNMDVKFPLDNYLRFLGADSGGERGQHLADFLRDVRRRVQEVTNREYINPEQGTVDYVLLFIPNESVYGFIHEHDPDLLDMAMRNKVVCCSPMTLYAVLAVVRQAMDIVALRQASDEIVSHLGRFNAEWAKFTDGLDILGRRIGSAQAAYEQVNGPRRRALERPLDRIEIIRQERGVPLAEGDTVDSLAPQEAEMGELAPPQEERTR
ncbi:MAG: DNA recombination protein RmuC [Dehalococcoidia bacterium]|nr:DNA recombination protein RmuC [Dehalococcoidia bacterium]